MPTVAYNAAITVAVTDPDGDLRAVALAVELAGTRENIYLSASGGEYAGAGSAASKFVVTRSSVSDGFEYQITRVGGWPGTALTVMTLSVDSVGNVVSSAQAYTIVPPVTASASVTVEDTDTGEDDPIDILLDPDTGDLDLSTGDLQLSRGIPAVVQGARQRVLFVLGEWFLDLSKGVDLFGQVFVKNPNLLAVNEMFRAELLDVPFVSSVVRAGMSFDRVTRAASFRFDLATDFGIVSDTVEVSV